MPPEQNSKKAHLTVIRGGKSPADGFLQLPFAEKLHFLRGLPAKKRIALIEADPEANRLVQAFPPQELYWMLTETGVQDALELVALSSPEQCEFFLDMELWEKWSCSQAKALEWLGYLLEAGEARFTAQLPHLDVELLTLICLREITVGGGLGDLATDDERTADWDHSFDNAYFITFRNQKNSRLIGTFLDAVYRHDQPLYLQIMEGVKNEVGNELEELAYGFRAGRLADLGFPEREDALAIYARVNPAAFVPAADKKLLPVDVAISLPAPLAGGSLLERAMALHSSPELLMELNYLINSALVAAETPFAEREGMEAVFLQVYGYLNIALEFLCGGDVGRAAEVLEGEYLKRLFQLGHSIVLELKRKAAHAASGDYATGKALLGLKATPPRFYRGLDPDGVDGYREFREMADVQRMEQQLVGNDG